MSIHAAKSYCALSVTALLFGVFGAEAQKTRGTGRIRCAITENGKAASGSLTVREGDTTIAEGSCATPVQVPAGIYRVTLSLDGALDRPNQSQIVTVRRGTTVRAEANFGTGTLEIVVEAGGRRAAAMATISRDGERVGTLGSGVTAHISAGTYDIAVRHRNEVQRFSGVQIKKGSHRTLAARFGARGNGRGSAGDGSE